MFRVMQNTANIDVDCKNSKCVHRNRNACTCDKKMWDNCY